MTLTDFGSYQLPQAVETREYEERLPGVMGEFVQLHGYGGQNFVFGGMIASDSKNTGELALANLQAKVVLRARLADGLNVGTYVGTDGVSYLYCIMKAFAQTEPAKVMLSTNGQYQAICPVQGVVRQLVPG